ncbi:hypothetical protein [Acidovorax sp. Leaf160]|uniref:hypothetical protein n=1 Tax=Acidovorax sp. Leaf160 TaxID=1736280 RepID=UPI000AECA404|nr:hypothetical protein [Acidovorax sp. Leaf160]
MISKKMGAAALLAFAGVAQAFAPQAGTWVVSSELNGEPGRGLSIDVQSNTFVMQMYAYEASGQPTFYLAVGDMVNDTVTAPLNQYRNGRSFGSGARSGVQTGSPGNVTVRFTSGITGFITFPGEREVAISRFNFGYGAVQESLRGLWTFNSMGSEGLQTDFVELRVPLRRTDTGNGLMADSAGRFGCEHQVSGSLAGSVLCVKVSSAGTLLRSYLMVYSVNEGEGYSVASSSSTQQMLSVRRITTPGGKGTGIVYKDADAEPGNPAALLDHISYLAQFGIVQ